jgi:putative transposase
LLAIPTTAIASKLAPTPPSQLVKNERPHGKDLRVGRYSEPAHVYVVTSVTYRRVHLFADWHIGRLLVHELKSASDLGIVQSLAWVIMPDHFHWLLSLGSGSLAGLMRRVKSRSAVAINRHLQTKQQVWQRGYHDHAVRRDEDLVRLARYIVANPLRTRIVAHIGDYPLWDSIWL